MTRQQSADLALGRWQELRAFAPDERLEIIMREFFAPPQVSDFEYQITINAVAREMSHG